MVNEIISWASTKKERLFVLKVDFEKAFDSLSWEFLDHTMEQMGFSIKWRAWIRGCLNNAYGSVLINGSPSKEFSFKKGLRQGDPLSPFLFIIAMEALHVTLQEAKAKGRFEGIKVGTSSIIISHLQFADDALILEGKWVLAPPLSSGMIHGSVLAPLIQSSVVNIHTWRATMDRLPTRYNLDARGMDLDSNRCPICDGCVKTSELFFIDYTIAHGLWKMISSWWKLGDYPKVFNNLLSWSDSVDIHDLAKQGLDVVIQTTSWVIWQYRNRVCFDSKPQRKDTLGEDIFTMSAVPLDRISTAVAECFSVLKPGLYDMTMLRFEADQRVGFREYKLADVTRSYFFSLDSTRDLFLGAGCWNMAVEIT
ncbi:putative RNA-directed DNA polymerase, eukaryota, reverse transcriptase zinc-binding domain protein [Tanacetum coccineum]